VRDLRRPTGHAREVVDPRRPPRPPQLLYGAVTFGRRAHADHDPRRAAVDGDDLGRTVGLEAQDRREVDPDSRDPSTATACSTSPADMPRAESSAIRRSAACSSAKVVNSVRAWLLPTATAMSCANWARRSSVPGGSGCEGEVAVNIPHTASDTVTGADTAAPRPYERASAASRSPA